MSIRKAFDLPLILIITVVAMALVLLDVQQPLLRTLFTLPLSFFFPGYTLVAALFPRQSLMVASRLLFALALSLALLGVGGLLLQVTRIGLYAEAWAVLVGMFTLVCGLVAMRRRAVTPNASVAPGATEQPSALRLNFAHLLMVAAAVVLVFFAFNMAQQGARQQQRPGFTQLWMLPLDATASEVQLGIRNVEQQDVTYRLVVEVGGVNVGEWESVPLAAGESWETSALIPRTAGADGMIEALLYRSDVPNKVYRSVTLNPANAS